MSVNRKKALLMTTAAAMPQGVVPAASTTATTASGPPAAAFVARNLRVPWKSTQENDKIFTKNAAIANSTFEVASTSATTIYDPSTLFEQHVIPDFFQKSLRSKLNVPSVYTTLQQHRPKVVGHRGCLYQELENTRHGFLRSYEVGCDAVELDVFLLKCGTVVVFHGGGTDENPGDLTHYCNLPEKSILDYTAEEARQLEFNPHFAEFACGPHRVSDTSVSYIPTLEQVLLDIKHKTDLTVKIELKGPGTPDPVLQMVEDLDMVDRCHFSSFSLDRIARIRELRPQRDAHGEHVYKTGALFNEVPGDYLERAMNAGASEVHLRYDTCTTGRIQEIHNAGLGSMAWFRGPVGMKSDTLEKYLDVGNEDFDMYRVLMRTGVQQMCVNKPDLLADLLLKQSMSNGYGRNNQAHVMMG